MNALRQRLHEMAGGLPRPYWFMWAGTFVTRCGSFVLPYLAIVLTRDRGLTPTAAGSIVALYGAGAALAAPLGGTMADKVGRRATLLLALFGGGAGMIALGFVSDMRAFAPLLFLVALLTEMYRPGMQAAVADLVPPQDRVRAFGLTYWVINLGYAIGVTLGGVVAGHSFRWLFVGDGLATMLFGALIAIGVPETRPAAARVAADASAAPRESAWAGVLAPYRDTTFVAFLALAYLYAVLFLQNAAALPLDMTSHGHSPATFGMMLALNGVLIVALQPFLGPRLAKRDRSRTLATGALFTAVGFGLNAFAHTVPLYVVGVVLWTAGEMCILPVANAMVADLAPVERRGRYQGGYSLSWGLAVASAPLLGMSVLEHAGSRTLWLGVASIAVAIAIAHLALAPRLRRLRAERMAAAGR